MPYLLQGKYIYADRNNPGVHGTFQDSLGNLTHGYVIYNPYAIPGFPKSLGVSSLVTDQFAYGSTEVQPPNGTFFSKKNEDSTITWQNFQAEGSFPAAFNFDIMDPYHESLDTQEQCATNLRSNIYSAQAGSQSGVFLGEIKQTISLLKSPTKSIMNAVNTARDALAKIKLSGIKRYSKAFTKAWSDVYLEFTFGVQPLLSDIDSVAQRINDILDKKVFIQVGAKASNSKKLDLLTSDNFILANMMKYDRTLSRHLTEEARGRALIVQLPAGPKFSSSNFGFRTDDFVPTLYELIPWSFLVDYFSNLNSLVNAQFYERSSVVFGYVTSSNRMVSTVKYSNFRPANAAQNFSGASTPLVVTRENKVRQTLSKIPDTISVSLPGARQITNILALLTSSLKQIR